MKMVDGKLVPDDTPTNVTGAENGSTNKGATDFAVTGSDGEVAEVKTEPVDSGKGGHQLSPAPTPSPIDANKTPDEVRGNPLNKGDLPNSGFSEPDSINLNKDDGPLKISDRPAQGADTVIRDEFKVHNPDVLSDAQATHVTALTEAKLADSPQNDDKRYTGAQKLGLIKEALRNKGLDSMQLINAMAEIKAILNW